MKQPHISQQLPVSFHGQCTASVPSAASHTPRAHSRHLAGSPVIPTSCFSLQLNLIHSEISNLAGFEVEAIINPTNADIDLKDDLGNWGWGLAPPAVR